MDYPRALNPYRSVVVEACAGSGKTWLLVSRIVRLLLEGVKPSEIVAITFTRKAAQEMQLRLRDWLYELASQDEAHVIQFLRARAVAESDIPRLLPRARGLYQQFLLAQPGITLSTFHSWFNQLLQRAPINAGTAGGMQLVEKTGALLQEAWQLLQDHCLQHPESPLAQSMLYLYAQFGLETTRSWLMAFVQQRSDWWVYTEKQTDAVAFSLAQLQDLFGIDLTQAPPLAQLLSHDRFLETVRQFADQLQASDAQRRKAVALLNTIEPGLSLEQQYAALSAILFTQKKEPAKLKPNKGQDETRFYDLLSYLQDSMVTTQQQLLHHEILEHHQHLLPCATALLQQYQQLKQQQLALDFTDVEWRVYQLLTSSEHAAYLLSKLDHRYKHVLLDEFQDTNPLQWQILQAWFDAATEVQSQPIVFLVGDPKQSIYRFRGADARLFSQAREFLQRDFNADYLTQNTTRRNAPDILKLVNGIFSQRDDYQGFEPHLTAHLVAGHVMALPLFQNITETENDETPAPLTLRNPLLTPLNETSDNARELEANAFAAQIQEMVGHWSIHDEGQTRPLQYGDIMVLVRARTHLQVYEQALRAQHIPYLSSRRGGLLETLEASDIKALLSFLMTPAADLALAQCLRSPIFSCHDNDLIQLTQAATTGCWWQRLQHLIDQNLASLALQRAHTLLKVWLKRADYLPVHDLLDQIYFEGDLFARYAAVVPEAMRQNVLANLQAFLEIALNVNAGRYPSLPSFLHELAALAKADDNEAPNEGTVSQHGNALRIYTVHESKGLEAPLVWLLDCNGSREKSEFYDVLIDWPPTLSNPAHFSLYGTKNQRGNIREPLFQQQQQLNERENLNLLYVALTRAKQILIASGNGRANEHSWYGAIQAALPTNCDNHTILTQCIVAPNTTTPSTISLDPRLSQILPTGGSKVDNNEAQQYGIWLHQLMEHMSHHDDPSQLQTQLPNIPPEQFEPLQQQAWAILHRPELQRFFDPKHYLHASNELNLISQYGELRRIDRLVEFTDEVWILDYKSGNSATAHYHPQLAAYRQALQPIYPQKTLRSAIIKNNGELVEVA